MSVFDAYLRRELRTCVSVRRSRPMPVFTCFLLNACLFLTLFNSQKQFSNVATGDEQGLAGISFTGTLRGLQASLHSGLQRGELRVGIAGGSVSTGAGCTARGWVQHLEDVLSTSLRPQMKLRVFNVAEGATGPDRVFYCLQNLLPNYRSLDVLFLEYAINEAGGTMSQLLLRRVINSTSVIFLDTFTLSAGPFRSAQQYHDTLARYYDVPLLSMRDALWHHSSADGELLEFFATDKTHPSCKGHRFLGNLAAKFLINVLKLPHRNRLTEITPIVPSFLELSAVNPPESVISSSPQCQFLYDSKLVKSGPGWRLHEGYKPYYECAQPGDGNLTITFNCEERIANAGCQILLYYTTSWQPLGSATVIIDKNEQALTLHGFNDVFRQSNLKWTVQTSNPWDSLHVQNGVGSINVECCGTSMAPESITGAYDRTSFRLHSFVLI